MDFKREQNLTEFKSSEKREFHKANTKSDEYIYKEACKAYYGSVKQKRYRKARKN